MLFLAAIAGWASSGTVGATEPQQAPAEDLPPGFESYVVVFEDAAAGETAKSRYGIESEIDFDAALNGFSAVLPAAAVAVLESDPAVKFVEPNTIGSADVQTLPEGIDRIGTDLNTTGAIDGIDTELDVDIAIIDSGIDVDHPDLRVVGGATFLGPSCNGTSYDDTDGHGTHVAGIAAARDNDFGVVGVAPGARLWSLKMLDEMGNGDLACVIAAVNWVTANAATIDVANMSLRFDPSPALCTAIANATAAGVVFAASAGNTSSDASIQSPANCADVLTTSAIADFDGYPGSRESALSDICPETDDDEFACFSNHGSLVDIAAPGVDVYSTYRNGGYEMLTGTSVAAPHVAGAAALDLLINGKPVDAVGAAAVHNRLVTDGFPQSGPHGFGGDPDTFPEPLLNVRSAGTLDAIVAAIEPPALITADSLAIVSVSVFFDAASGSATAEITLATSGGTIIDSPQTVNLAADATAQTDFAWNTAGMAPGDHQLTATLSTPPPGDANSATNVLTRMANVLPEPTPVDTDGDQFVDTLENAIGTDPLDACANSAAASDEPEPHAWPLDFNDDQTATTLDLGVYAAALNSSFGSPVYLLRADLDANGAINTLDLGPYAFWLNSGCEP